MERKERTMLRLGIGGSYHDFHDRKFVKDVCLRFIYVGQGIE